MLFQRELTITNCCNIYHTVNTIPIIIHLSLVIVSIDN